VDAGTPMIRPVFETAAIEQAATPRLVLDTVRSALIAHGRTTVPPTSGTART